MKKFALSRLALMLCGFIAASTLSAFAQANHLVISQVYGGGGNSGAVYTNDFIELYNPTSSAISTSGLSIQYTSATGTFSTSNSASLAVATIQPGHYFLIQAAAGTATIAALPTPDSSFTGTNLSATVGKVALVSNASTLIGGSGCPLPNANVIDFVGYGTTANCSEGGVNAAAPANATAVIRKSPSVDTDNNGADFMVGTPVPHNSSFGGATGALGATGSGSPATVIAGNTSLLTVTVTPAASPASTGITVTGDLRLIGGSQTQAFTSGSNNTFTFNATVTTTSNGTIALPISVADGQGRTATTTISLIVNQPVATVAIDAIQGVKSKTALSLSPYAGQSVTTTGIVTAVIPAAVFIQTPDNQADGNPLTPEGIQVYYGTGKVPANIAVGTSITVTGPVATYPALTTATVQGSSTPATEINVPVSTVINSQSNPLPAPITLTTSDLTPNGGLFQLTPYEGMRVTFASLTTTSGTEGSLAEATETITSTGAFYAVIGNTPRPFRQPGIDIRDLPVQNPMPANVAHFDDNPERIYIDSDLAGGTGLEVSTGAVLNNPTGVLDFTFTSDQYYDPSRLILDATYNRALVTPGLTVQPVPAKAANEFTVAAYNIERFFNTLASDDIYKTSTLATATPTHPDLTQAAYTRRLQKVSLAVRTVLNNPDVVTLEEVENQSVANDIAAQINTDAGIPGLYTALSTDNSTYYTQDGTGISVGFLYKNTVDKIGFSQYGYGEVTPSGTTLNDRPWLVLNAGIKRGAGVKDYPVTVIVNHMKSLINVNSTTSGTTRLKKELQSEDIARYIQGLQANGTHVISGGDFNAFEFSDGYTDTLATYTNVNVLPPDQIVQPGVAGLVTPPLVDLALNLPVAERWSYQESGSAQILDHIVVTPELVSAGAHLAYAHMNADFPESATNDATTAARNSDHDAAVGYFAIPAPVLSATLTPASANFGTVTMNEVSAGQGFTLTNTGETALTVTSITASGDFTASNTCGSTLAISSVCGINVVFAPTAGGTRTGTLTVVTGGATYTSTLTGTGTAVTAVTTTTSLTLTPASPVTAGATVTLTASVLAGASPATTGTVAFYDGAALLGSAQVSTSGTAVLKLVPGVGTHTYQAQLQASVGLTASSSTQQVLVVTGTGSYATSGLLTYIANGSTYSATDTVTFYGQSLPAGAVNFTDLTSGYTASAGIGTLTQTLAAATPYTTGAASTGSLISATGDFNKDGIPDIAVTNLVDNTVSVLLGKGGITASYQAQVSYPVGRAPYGVATGDFNNDGNLDLAVTNLVDGTVSVLLGSGTGAFAAQTAFPTGSTGQTGATTFPEPYGLLVADINKDGRVDLVTTNLTEGSVSVLLGTGTGAFAAPVTTTVGGEPITSVAADFNNDGNADLLVVNATSNNAALLVGNGNGSFTVPATPTYATGLTPYAAAVGDFNNDGYPDVVVTNLGAANQPPTTGSVTVLLNNAGNGFTTATYATGVEPTSVAVFDFNNDGKLDIAVTNSPDNNVGILTGTGTGTFNAQTAYPSIANPYALSVADLNGDGKQDLVVTGFGGNTVGIQYGTQTGVVTFNGVPTGVNPDTASATYTAGNSDAYATSTSNTITVPGTGSAPNRATSTKKVATPKTR